MKLKVPVVAAAVTFVSAATALPAAAEIVFLSSGRTLSVKAHRSDGESIVLALRSGGEVTVDRTLIERILPDEVPFPEPPVQSAAQPPQSQDSKTADISRVMETTPYGAIIAAMSEAHGVDPLLVRALIQVESAYRPRARSRKGAMGLMQLMPATAREYRVRNAYDPRSNIEAGIKHLKSLIDRWGEELGLAAYNAGEGAVKKFNGVPPYRETRNYVARILGIAGRK
jgi:hypothetical protein